MIITIYIVTNRYFYIEIIKVYALKFEKWLNSMSYVSVCASQIIIATIPPPHNFQTSHNRLYNDRLCEVRLAQISSGDVTQHQRKQSPQNGDLPPPSSQQPPRELPWMNPRLLRTAQLSRWPAVPPATSTWSLHALTIQPHPGNKSLVCELPWNACRVAKWLFVSPSKVQTLSVFNTSLCYQRWRWDKSDLFSLRIDSYRQYFQS